MGPTFLIWQVVRVSDQEAEARYVVHQIQRMRLAAEGSPPSIGILYRTNAQARHARDLPPLFVRRGSHVCRFEQAMPVERELLRQVVPYELMQARSFFQRKEVRDALCYLRLLHADDDAALERIINVPPRRIGGTTWSTLRSVAEARGTSIWSVVSEIGRHVASGEELPAESAKVGKIARRAIAKFHGLIERYRHVTRGGEAEGVVAAEAGSEADGGETGEVEEEEDDDMLVEARERLRIAGTELLSRRKARETADTDDEGEGEGVDGPNLGQLCKQLLDEARRPRE